MSRLVIALLGIALTSGSCRTTTPSADQDSDLTGTIAGQGGPGYGPELIDMPHREAVRSFLQSLRDALPDFVKVVLDKGIDENHVIFWHLIKLNQEPGLPIEYEPCEVSGHPGEEVRAGYYQRSIQLCRMFFKWAPSFENDTDQNYQVRTLLHELAHYYLDMKEVEIDEEEHFVLQMESLFDTMLNRPERRDLALGILDEILEEQLNLPQHDTAPLYTQATVERVYWQNHDHVAFYMAEMARVRHPYLRGANFFLNIAEYDIHQHHDQLDAFFAHVTRHFRLSAPGYQDVSAIAYGGTVTNSSVGLYSFAIQIQPHELEKMVVDVPYRLIPFAQEDYEHQWIIGDDIVVVRRDEVVHQ